MILKFRNDHKEIHDVEYRGEKKSRVSFKYNMILKGK